MLRRLIAVFFLYPCLSLIAAIEPNTFLKPEPKSTYLTLTAGYDHLDANTWSYNTLPATHHFLDGTIGTATFGWFWDKKLCGYDLRSDIMVSVAGGSKSQSVVIPTNDLYFLVTDPTVNFPGGLPITDYFGARQLVLDSMFAVHWDILCKRLIFSPYLGIQAAQVTTRYTATGLLQNLWERLRTNYLGLAVGFDSALCFAKNWSVQLGGSLSCMTSHTNFTVNQFLVNTNVTLNQRSQRGTGRFQLDGGLVRRFGECAAGIFVKIDNWSYSPRIMNPNSVSSKPVYITSKQKTDTSVTLQLNIPFGKSTRQSAQAT